MDGGVLTIPFMGVAADMTTLPLFNATSQPFTTSTAHAPNDTIADDGSTVFSMQGEDTPAVNFGLTFPSRVVRLDVLPVNLDAATNTTFAGVKILGLFLFSNRSDNLEMLISSTWQVDQFWGTTIRSTRSLGMAHLTMAHKHQTGNIVLAFEL